MALHLVVTDSGVGGLSACAAVERALRVSDQGAGARITYVNAWPSEQGGYNDMADIRAEAEVFDRALDAMVALDPDRIVIACNTLSIVYEHTECHRRATFDELPTPDVGRQTSDFGLRTCAFRHTPVIGIVDAGVQLFHEALAARQDSRIALFGTKTTIASGVHRERLIAQGIAPARILPVGCHGLAKSIETEMDGPATMRLIEECTARGALLSGGAAGALFLGVCCTHYTYLREEMRAALQRHVADPVEVLDPTDRLVSQVVPSGAPSETTASSVSPAVKVISKVRMPEEKRRVIARRLATVSEPTARAVLDYTHVPDLF